MKLLLYGILLLLNLFSALRLSGQEGGGDVPVAEGISQVRLAATPPFAQLTYPVGGQVELSLAITSEGDVAYNTAWLKVGRPDTLSREMTLGLANLALADAGSYYCLVTDKNDNSHHYSDTLDIKVSNASITSVTLTQTPQPAGNIFRAGQPVEFGLNVSMFGNLSYTCAWRKIGRTDVLSDEPTMDYNKLTGREEGRYYCILTADGKQYSSDTIHLKVVGTRVHAYGYTRLCAGDSVRYAVTVSDTFSYSYKWYKEGNSVPITTQSSYLIAVVDASSAGRYYCKVHDDTHGFDFLSDTLEVSVSAYPELKLTVNGTDNNAGRSFNFCYGTEVQLNIVNNAPSQPDARFLWTGNNINGMAGNAAVTVPLKYTGVYRAMITNNGCVRKDSVRLVMKRPAVILPETRLAIEGETISLESAAPDDLYKYAWSKAGSSEVVSSAARYDYVVEKGKTKLVLKVQTSDALKCENTDTCYVTGLPKINYTTSINDGYVISRGGLKVLQKDTVLCAREPLTLEVAYAGYDGYTYEWMRISGADVTPVDTGRIMDIASLSVTSGSGVLYFCRAFDVEQNGYVHSDTVKVTVNYRPVARISSPDPAVRQCGGYPLILKGEDADMGYPMTRYRWEGSGILSGVDENELHVKIGPNGYYRLEVKVGECADTAEINIPTHMYSVDIASQLILPQPTNGVEFVAAKPEDGKLTWFPNGDAGRSVITDATANAALDILAGDTLVVVRMEKSGCSFYDTCHILIREFNPPAGGEAPDDGFAISLPILRVTATDPRVCLGRDITLSVYDLGYGNYKYDWRKVHSPADITGLSDSISCTLFRADVNTPGKYFCVATDPENPGVLIYSDTLNLVLDQGPLAEIRRDEYSTLCYGEVITINARTSVGNSSDPSVADKLEWKGDGILEGQGTASIKIKVGNNARYTLVASKNSGCWSQDTITFPVVKPEVRITPQVKFLARSGEVNLVAETKLSNIEWWHNGVKTSFSGTQVKLPFKTDGNVVVVASQDVCQASDTARIFVKDSVGFRGGNSDGFALSRPRLTIPQELKMIYACPDSMLTFWVTHADYANYKYQWWKVVPGNQPVLMHSGLNYSFKVTGAAEAGEYYCTAVQSEATSGMDSYLYSDTLLLRVNNGPIAQIACDNNQICYDGSVLLDASASGEGLTYFWTGEGISEEAAQQPAINVSPVKNSIYTVRVSNSVCSDTALVAITVIRPEVELPALVQLAAPVPAYKVKAKIPDGVTVEWSFLEAGGTNPVPGSGEVVNVSGDGWIIAKSMLGGCVAYDSCRVIVKAVSTYKGGENDGFGVQEVTTRIWLDPQVDNLEICLNNQLSLKAVVSGLSNYTYSWHRVESAVANDPGVSVGREADLLIQYITKEQEGHYYCIVTDTRSLDAGGEHQKYYSDTVNVRIKEGPIAAVKRVDGASWDACVGSEIDLEGSLKNSDYTGDLRYEWSGDYYKETNNQRFITAQPRGNGFYLLRVSDDLPGGCSDTVHVRFNMHAPEVKLPEVYQFAAAQSVDLKATVNGNGAFSWYKGVYQDGNTFSSSNPANLYVSQDEMVIVRFEQEGCYGFDTTRLYVKAKQSFMGGDADGYSASTLQFKVWVEQKEQKVCRGSDIEIPLHIADLGRVMRYKWYKVGSNTVLSEERTFTSRANNMTDGGQYYCVVVDPAVEDMTKRICHSDTATVIMQNGPLAQISSPDDNQLKGIFCRGADVSISAAATEQNKVSASDVYSYEWWGEGITYTARNYEVIARPGENGRYIVKASLGECYTYDTIQLKVYEPKVEIQPVIFLSKPGEVVLSVENPDNNEIWWRYFIEYDPGTIVGNPQNGSEFRREILEDSRVIVERIDSRCSGYDTCRIFVKASMSFRGGSEDGFMTGGSGFYNKPIEYTKEVCEGEVATLFVPVIGDDFYRYKWVKVGDEGRELSSAALCKIDPVTKNDEGYYYCIITDVNNNRSLTADRVYMKVKEVPVSSIIAEHQVYCYGEMLTLKADTAHLTSGVKYNYLWNGKGVADRFANTLSVKAEESSRYQLVVSDGDCYMTDSIDLKVQRNRLEFQPVYYVKKGDDLTLSGKVNGGDSLLTWQIGTAIYRGVNPLLLAAANITRSVPFTVSTTGRCEVKGNGYIYLRDNTPYAGGNDDGYVLPNDLPQLLDQGPVLLGCDVDTATLWISAVQTDDLRYQWERYSEVLKKWEDYTPVTGKTNVKGHESDSLVFSAIYQEDAGRYRCKLRNTYGYTYSREVRLVKGGAPLISIPLVPTDVCESKTQGFRFISQATIPQQGTMEDLTWRWYYSKDVVNYTQKTPFESYNNNLYEVRSCAKADEGFYMVEARNFCGSSYDTVFQEIWQAPTFVEQPKDVYVCNKADIEVTTKVKGGGTYTYALWQVNVDNNGNYVSDKLRRAVGLTSPSYTFSYAQADASGYYVWKVQNKCDSVRSKPFRLTVEQEIATNFEGKDTTVCAGVNGNLVLVATNNVTTTPTMLFRWTKDGIDIPNAQALRYTISRVQTSDAGLYMCYAKNSCPEKPVKQYKVKTQSRAVPTDIIVNPAYCEGEPINMKIDYTSDAGEPTFAWFQKASSSYVQIVDNARISGAATAVLKINGAVSGDAGQYYVQLTNGCGPISSTSASVVVNMPARFTRTFNDVVLCAGGSTTLSVTASGVSPIVYTWWKDDVKIPGATTSSLALNNVSHSTTGKYTCTIQNSCSGGTSNMTSATVSVITPNVYDLQGAGGYCAEDFREITLSGFEKNVVYTLKRRFRLDEVNYTTLKTVSGDTVSSDILTFGRWGTGYYAVDAVRKQGGTTCSALMKGEIYIYQNPTPEQFDFYVSDPMCKGEREASLTLSGSQLDRNIVYNVHFYNNRTNKWVPYQTNLAGTGDPILVRNVGTGVYRMIAENIVSGCKVQVGQNDTVAERPYPEIYNLYAVDKDTTACFGMESDVVLQLDNSEKSCTYTLYRDGLPTDRSVSGNLIQWDKVEGGSYTVHAVTQYGCEKDMNGSVKVETEQLKRWILSGQKVFCSEETGNTHTIMLEGSTPGIRYDFYSIASEEPFRSVFGKGDFLLWDVALYGNATYYVMGVDTLNKCIQAMADSIDIEANKLELEVMPDKLIQVSTKADLWVNIANAMGMPKVTWEPVAKIERSEIESGRATAQTTPLDYGELFAVKVEDDFCVKDTTIRINVKGERLRAEIRAADCFTPLDTLFLCRGDDVSLCSFITGGGDSYQFKWTDEQYTDSIPVAHKGKITYTRKVNKDGFVVLYVSSVVQTPEGDHVKQENRDTVWISMRERPDIAIGNAALNCIVPGVDTAIVLTATEDGVRYRLDYRSLPTLPYTEKGQLVGDGMLARFEIQGYTDAVHSGYYRITAIKDYQETTCQTQTPAFQLRRSPEKHIVSSSNITEYCQGERQDTIYVDHTENDVTYRLMRNKTVQVKQSAGTGGELVFTGSYGTGDYRVVAVLDRCIDTMTNHVVINSKKRPVIEHIAGVKDYCETDEVKVTLSLPIPAVRYSLYKKGYYEAVAQENASSGREDIELIVRASDEYSLPGYYFVVAYDQALQCSDTVKGLVITPNPGALSMEKTEVSYCDNLPGYDGRALILTGADSLIHYELREYDGVTKVGDFVHIRKDSIYYNGVVNVPTDLTSQMYKVYANAGGCSGILAQFSVTKSQSPMDRELAGDTLGCVGYPLTMGVKASQAGITYSLYREGEASPLVDAQPGGGNLEFGAWSELGTYYVVARNQLGCEQVLSRKYRIRELPKFFKIYTPGDASYCENTTGIKLGITGSQRGVTYMLQRLENISGMPVYQNIAGGELTGSGTGAVTFAGNYKAGDYRIATDYCRLLMYDTLQVTEKPLPLKVAFDYEGMACVDSTMQLMVGTPETGTNYTLQYNKAASGLPVLPGSGDVKWDIAAAQNGTYSVAAERSGCIRVMEEEIIPGEVAKIGNLEGILPDLCKMAETDLYLTEWEEKSKYSLFTKTDTVEYPGSQVDGKIVFGSIPAGFDYYVAATNRNCRAVKGAFNFPGMALPELADNILEVVDCQRNGIAAIQLKGLNADLYYTLSGVSGNVYRFETFSGDTLVNRVDNGTYELTAYNPKTQCTSSPLEATVRWGIPADSIVSRLSYCKGGSGVQITLSGQSYGVNYNLERLSDNTKLDMSATLTAGRYVFYRERTGLWGGCWMADTFDVKEYPYPSIENLDIDPKNGALCEVGNNAIVIHNSEKNVHYILQNAVTRANIDTIFGNGGDAVFMDRKPAGSYNILMRYEGICERTYYKTLKVNEVPTSIATQDIEFCAGEADAGGYAPSVSGLKTSASYTLYTQAGIAVDSLRGVNAGYFKPVQAGHYYVTGTYLDTRCTDIVGQMSVRKISAPKTFEITNANGGGDCAGLVDVALLSGCEGDSVRYYLYMDDFYRVEGPVTAQGGNVRFQSHSEPGSYSVYAVKGAEDKCGTWMNGRVILYARPAMAKLNVNGYNCPGGQSVNQVNISASKTVRTWSYYLSDGTSVSERKEGTSNTEPLTWNQIGGKSLKSGRYVLYAISACDTIIKMDSVMVRDAAPAAKVSLNKMKDGVRCTGAGYDCVIKTSQNNVTYTLNVLDNKNAVLKTWSVEGDGSKNLFLASVENDDNRVKLYATVDSSQCTYVMDSLRVYKDNYADNPGFTGASVCGDTFITIALAQPRVPLMDYYLMVNGHAVDTIFGDAEGFAMTFDPQMEMGCYDVYITSKTGQCDTIYPTKLCKGESPQERRIRMDWDGNLCSGDSHNVVLLEPQPGVSYLLLRDGMAIGSPVQGIGDTLLLGTVKQAGRYTVLGSITSECSITMQDILDVKVLPRPELHVQKEYFYTEGTNGVVLATGAPTTPNIYYQISEGQKAIDYPKANAYGDPVTFNSGKNGGLFSAGTYYIKTFDIGVPPLYTCSAFDTIRVKTVGVSPFKLEVVGTPYMCSVGECRALRLNGSEKGVYYELFRKQGLNNTFIAGLTGTGKVMDFQQQCDTGYYSVRATKTWIDPVTNQPVTVSAQMGEAVHLFVASKLEKFQLKAGVNGYCLSGDDKNKGSVILEGSQSDQVTYQLYCNGMLVPGKALTGIGGGALRWSGLEGKTCEGNSDMGNVYSVVATDGKCEVSMSGDISIVAVTEPFIRVQTTSFTACTGNKTPMTVSATGCLLNYEWTFNGQPIANSNSLGYTIDSVGMENMGTYVCRVSNYCGSKMTEPIEMSVREVVRVDHQIEDKMVCGGSSQKVELVSGAFGGNYYWYKVGNNKDTLSREAIYTIPNANELTDAGEYVCCTWNSCGAVNDTVRLEFNRVPSVTGYTYTEKTLCRGSAFSMRIESRDSLDWFWNNTQIGGKHDKLLKFSEILPEQAGAYKVVARNVCDPAGKEFPLASLSVDDTLRILSVPVESKHYCQNSPIVLELKLSPGNKGVTYSWYKRNSLLPGEKSNVYSATARVQDDGAWFELKYQNQCTQGSVYHTMFVDKPVHLSSFARDSVITTCTGRGSIPVIIRDDAQDIPEYNKYRWYRVTGKEPLLVSSSDTLRVEKKVVNSGMYYCEVSNACSGITVSGKLDLRIDTVPVIKSQPVANNPYCEGMPLTASIQATGGDLEYRWYLRKKKSSTSEMVGYYKKTEFSSSSTLDKLPHLTMDYDSCKMWCVVENGCNYVVSDTLLIQVSKEVHLTVDKEIGYLCPNTSGVIPIAVAPTPTVARWVYNTYKEGAGDTVVHNVYTPTDTLKLTEAGTYGIFGFYTASSKCITADKKIMVSVVPQELFYANIDHEGADTVCQGEKVKLRLAITGGKAPWRVDIRRRSDGLTAPELGALPVEIWSRDTVFTLLLQDKQTFYIASATQFKDPTACPGVAQGEDVTFTIQKPYGTYLGKVSQQHFGACQQLDMAATFGPYPEAGVGKFYINGVLAVDHVLKGNAGKYDIVYKAVTSAGCRDSASLTVWLDSLPSGTIRLSDSLICPGGRSDLVAEFAGNGPFGYQIQTYGYDRNGKQVARPSTLPGTVDAYASYVISFDEDQTADSMRLYKLSRITDKYGCSVAPGVSAKLLLHRSPSFIVSGSHANYNGGIPTATVKDFVVPRSQKNVDFLIDITRRGTVSPLVALITNTTPEGKVNDWSSGPKNPGDTTISVTATTAGIWSFKVSDAYCTSKVAVTRTITHLDTGFVRVRAMLQGAYSGSEQPMKSALWPDLLPKNGWSKWPNIGARTGIDWVTVEMREGSVNGTKVFSGQFLLLSDGAIVDRVGRETLPIPNADFATPYYIVVKHRNHLAIASRNTLLLKSKASEASLMDMTVIDNIYLGGGEMTTHVAALGRVGMTFVWGMYAGNVLGNSLVSIRNPNEAILHEVTIPGYYKADVNFDGIVTIPERLGVPGEKDDVSIMYRNRDKYSEIIE